MQPSIILPCAVCHPFHGYQTFSTSQTIFCVALSKSWVQWNTIRLYRGVMEMDKAQKCSTLLEKLPPLFHLRLFQEVVVGSGGTGEGAPADSELFVQFWSLSASLQRTVAWMGGWFYWSACALPHEWERLDLGVALENIFPLARHQFLVSVAPPPYNLYCHVQNSHRLTLDSLSGGQ